jgi:hypothetical protein
VLQSDPMKYRVITVAPLGDGSLLVRCQEHHRLSSFVQWADPKNVI